MRSIKPNRVAAIVTGATLIGATLATGAIGAVQTQGDVSGLVSTIKNNLNDVQVVVGTNGAAISDGVAAAKIAATLATENFAPASTVSGATVEVETTSTGGGITISPDIFTLELARGGDGFVSTSGGYKSVIGNVTLTPTQLGGVLTKQALSAYISGSVQSFQYQEEIVFGPAGKQPYVQYHEAGPNPSGHGLYLSAPYGTLQYKLNFQAAGQGIPTNGTAYNEVPSVSVLGNNYAIDTTELTNGRFVLYSGAKQEILEGESVTVGDATITVTGVGQITSASGTSFTAIIRAEKGGTSQTQTIQRLSGFDFFASQGDAEIITIYVEEIVYGASRGSKVIARVGNNRIRFNVGQQFPLDSNWNIQAVDITGNQATNGLRSVTLQYGNPAGANAFERGTLDATVNNGLAQGLTIPGPKNVNGQSTWFLKFVGLGGATQTDSTEVILEGVGLNSSSTTTSVIQATWTDRDGILSEFKPSDRNYANISIGDDATATVGLVLGTTPYTIINDKAIWFSQIKQVTSGTNTQYTPRFKVGGVSGFDLDGTTNTSASAPTGAAPLNSTLSYTGGVSGNTISCVVGMTGANSLLIYGLGAGSTCDLSPESIVLGTKTVFDRASTTTPALNLNFSGVGNSYVVVDNLNIRPAAYITPTSGYNAIVYFDDTSTSSGNTTNDGSGTTTGLRVYNHSTTDAGTAFLTGEVGLTNYIDQSKSTAYETDYYHIATSGSIWDGSVGGRVVAKLFEAAPSTIVQIGSLGASNVSSGTSQTVSVGGTIGGVKIVGVNVGGNAYTATTTLDPASLVTTDTAATKGYKIVVGGPYVNIIAQGMSAASLITQAGAQYLVAEDNNLLVAGYLGTDTAAAADELIRLLKA